MSHVKFITKFWNFNFCTNFSNVSAFTLFWLGIRYELVNSMDLGFKMNWSIVWVIMGRRGVSSERRRSSCSSWFRLWFIPFSTWGGYLNQCCSRQVIEFENVYEMVPFYPCPNAINNAMLAAADDCNLLSFCYRASCSEYIWKGKRCKHICIRSDTSIHKSWILGMWNLVF